jgi:hypothetical protein
METYSDLTKKIKRLDLLIAILTFACVAIFLAAIVIGIILIKINYFK